MIKETDKLYKVIANNIDLLPVVNRFDIKSNIGQKDIEQICIEKNINTSFFLSILNTFDSDYFFPQIDEIDLDSLINFLLKTHEDIKDNTIPNLSKLVRKLKIQNPDEKFIIIIENYFNEYILKLNRHIAYEEKEIFPLVEKWNSVTSKENLSFLKKISKQHENVENEISDLMAIIIQHLPEHAEMSLINEILHTLSHFEKEQIDHARFEEKILLPKLIALFQ